MIDAYERARKLVGCIFKPYGHDPRFGLDCIGLVVCAYAIEASRVPTYRFSDGTWKTVASAVSSLIPAVAVEKPRAGDLLVIKLPRCFHFAVLGDGTMIHADLRVRRVVECPIGHIFHEHAIYRAMQRTALGDLSS